MGRTTAKLLRNAVLVIICLGIAVCIIIFALRKFKKAGATPDAVAAYTDQINPVLPLFAEQSTDPLILSYPSNYDHSKEPMVRSLLRGLIDKFLAEVDKKGELTSHKESLLDVLVMMKATSMSLINYVNHPNAYPHLSTAGLLQGLDLVRIKEFHMGYFPYAELFFFFRNAVRVEFIKTTAVGGFKSIGNFPHARYLTLDGAELEEIPDLTKMTALENAVFTGNKLKGTVSLHVLPPNIQFLDLSRNRGILKLEGLESLTSLKDLVLDLEVVEQPGLCDFEKLRVANPALLVSLVYQDGSVLTTQAEFLHMKSHQ